ncbi:MAG: hypothetical protein ABR991_04950, partial [Terracidiphilus sp.]
RLAIADEPGFALSLADAPKSSGIPNYTLETLLALRAELPPQSALFCLMGADSFATLKRWHRAAEIPFTAPLIVASRPGESLEDLEAVLPEGLTLAGPVRSPGIDRLKGAEDLQATDHVELRCYILRNSAGAEAPLYLLPGLEIEISASAIREQQRIREKMRTSADGPAPEDALLPRPVSDYIRAHGLYR